jgi:UTP--glucose-1-phosphate uridylyltransferase
MFTRQQHMLGLGHAVWCARHMVGDEPFAVILADDMVQANVPCLKQMIAAYNKSGGNILGVADVPRERTSSYGIVDIDKPGTTKLKNERMVKAKALVEKPQPKDAPSTLSIIGRYILQPEIFGVLEKVKPGAGGEIQLTDAINAMIKSQDVYGFRYDGTRYDCGVQEGYVMANLAYALERKELREKISGPAAELLKKKAK